MGTSNPTDKSTCNLLRGPRGFKSAVIVGVISAHEPPSTAEEIDMYITLYTYGSLHGRRGDP